MRALLALLLALATLAVVAAEPAPAPRPPNFLIILADDLGYSDLGCYGGEIATPHLDQLAANGLRYTQFYNTGRCWPSRTALLTGHYPQQVRMDPPRGRLPEWARLLPHHLKPAGYRCYHAGKWHVMGAPKIIADGGFDRSYLSGDDDRNFHPRAHFEDDQRLPTVQPGSGYYTTTAYTDRLVGYLREHAAQHSGKPFFAYLAFTVPHFPLHAPEADIARVGDRYDVGWNVVAERRARRARELGIVTGPAAPPEPAIQPHWNMSDAVIARDLGPDEVGHAVPWTLLTESQRRFQARKMAVHAAMVERMDAEIGRVLEQVRSMGALDNTVVVFASDNGASAEMINRGDRHDTNAVPGSAASYLCLGPGWSTAANAPLRLHKSWVHEGGTATPFILHWPAGVLAKGALRHSPAHLIDLVPTVLELAGAKAVHPPAAPPLPGRSLVPSFASEAPIDRPPIYFHHEHNRALRDGDWKIVTRRPATNTWALHHIPTDRAEQRDLSHLHPDRVRALAAEWERLTARFAEESR